MTTLQLASYLALGGLLVGYAILDGFDLGVGFWSMFTKKDEEKRVMLNSIGPVWDGNEVWLVTAGVLMLAAFPPVYATVFSGMYLAVMLLLLALVARAVSIEFRGQLEHPGWRRGWDWAFGLGSSCAALLFGVALGNILNGMPLDERGYYTGGFFGLLNPYSLLIGVLGLAMLATHGAIWVGIKADGELEAKAKRWAMRSWVAYATLWAVAAVATLATRQGLLANYSAYPIWFAVPVAAVACLYGARHMIRRGRMTGAFLFSATTIALNMALVGVSLFPHLVHSPASPENSLTIVDSASSEYSLKIVLTIVALGMPLVLGYTFFVYRSFQGKVRKDELVY